MRIVVLISMNEPAQVNNIHAKIWSIRVAKEPSKYRMFQVIHFFEIVQIDEEYHCLGYSPNPIIIIALRNKIIVH
jgi:hypothetical protein